MINLLPSEFKIDLRFARRNAVLRWYVFLMISIVVIISGVFVGAMWFAQREVAQAENDLTGVQADLDNYKDVQLEAGQLRDTLAVIKELFQKQTDYLAVMRDIENATISSASLQSLSLSGDDTKALSLQYLVPSETAAASLRISLERSDRFSFVDIENISKIDDDGSGNGFMVAYRLAFETGKAR